MVTNKEELKEKIKEEIIKYCEGTYHLEFTVDDFDDMTDDIIKLFEVTNK